MTGRRVLRLREYHTLFELKQRADASGSPFLQGASIGKPTLVSPEEYLLIPATEHYTVAVAVRRPGLFCSANRLILFICETAQAAPSGTDSILGGFRRFRRTLSLKEERTGPAEQKLLAVTCCLREIFRSELLN